MLLSQANRFHDAGIPFYPSLGNHEVLPEVVPLLKQPPVTARVESPRPQSASDLESRVVAAYDAGEEPAASPRLVPEATAVGEASLDPKSNKGQKTLKSWERGIAKGDTDAAKKYGEFQRHL